MDSKSRKQSRYLIAVMIVIAVAMAGWSTPSLWAQAIYGSIYGQITDSTGAAIANATVSVTDVTKGTSVQVTTSPIGEYSVQHLIPDTYDVTVTATGFRGASSKGIRVSADTSPKVDLKLDVGQASESVTVTTEAPQLKTDRADVALVLDEKTVSDLPNSGRNFASLELLIPGTQVMGWSQNSAEDPQGSPTVQINGQHFSGVGYELDGAANQDPILGQIVINPPLDAVTEAKITTQDYDAQFGQAVAAVVTAQTKSGTNSFHGDLFDYRRTDATRARDPFSQVEPDSVTHRLIPSAKYNQFGGSFGGPIFKNKSFFFVDYQGTRQILGSSARETVPTALVQSSCAAANIAAGTGGCDLSDYLTYLGPVKGQIYNPHADGIPAFANNFIPAQYLSPQALALLAMIPLPNLQVPAGQQNNFAGSGSGKQHNDEVDIRVDEQVSERTHAFGRYSLFNNGISSNTIFGKAGGTGFSSPTNSFGGTATGRSQSAVAGMDIALSPQLLTDFRLGYLRYHVKTTKYSTADLASQVGIPGLNIPGQPFTSGPPAFYLNGDGLSNFGSALGVDACNCPLLETEDQYQIVNNWTRTLGTHSLKFGVDVRYARNLRVPSDSNRAGELSFSATDTESPSAGGGFGLGSFLLGDVTSFNRYVSISTNAKESQKRLFTYIEDSWRVTPKLTFNYGLRWELYFPETVNGKGQGGFPDLNTGQIRVAGYGPYNTAMNVGKTWKTLAPRLGVAYQLNPKTVIRAGYGRSFDIGVFGSIFGHMVTQNLPVLVNQFAGNQGLDTHAFTLATGPDPFVFPTIPSNGAIPIEPGNNVKIRNDPNVFPTIDAWNIAVQRQLSRSTSITVAYVGNKGTHTFMGDDKSTNPNEPAACLPASQSVDGLGLCFDPAASGATLTSADTATTTSNTANLRPYFRKFKWTQDLTYYHNGFDTNYNALQLTFEKRFSQGLQMTANYAFQRAYNYGSNEVYKKFQHGRTDDLRDHQLTLFGNYDLPFGKKGKYASGVSTWVDYLIGGYTLTTSLNWASGLPFSVSYAECGQDVPSGPCRPNKGSGSFPLKLTSYDPATHSRTYFTPPGLGAAFTRPSLDQTGTSPRNSFNGPGFFNDDLALLKTIPIRESVALQFRMDAFNVFNHINPGNPGNTCIDCQGAGVITGMALGDAPRQLQFALTLKF